jgi:hypothetical protein
LCSSSSTAMLFRFKSVRLNRSTIPSDCGWYGVVRVFVMPRS